MEKKNIVFLTRLPITNYYILPVDFELLRGKGFNVIVFDLSLLVNRITPNTHTIEQRINGVQICNIESYLELEQKISEFNTTSIFIDYILGLGNFDIKMARIFQLLKKYKVQYYAISARAIPVSLFYTKSFFELVKVFLHKIKTNTLIFWIRNRIKDYIFTFITRYLHLFPIPNKIFGTNSETMESYISKFNINRKNIVPTHSWDYDRFLDYQSRTKREKFFNFKTCVFLDELAANNTDYQLLNIKPFDDKKYFKDLNYLFDYIEKNTNLKVVIAAHPRFQFDENFKPFGERAVIQNKTVDLIAESDLVISTASTSIGYAVMFKRPLLLVKTSEMIDHLVRYCDTFGKVLGIDPVMVDCEKPLHVNLDVKISHLLYENYLYKYIKSRSVKEIRLWEIVSQEILSENLHSKV